MSAVDAMIGDALLVEIDDLRAKLTDMTGERDAALEALAIERGACDEARALAKLHPEQLAAALGCAAGTPWPVLLERAQAAEGVALRVAEAEVRTLGCDASIGEALAAWHAVATS